MFVVEVCQNGRFFVYFVSHFCLRRPVRTSGLPVTSLRSLHCFFSYLVPCVRICVTSLESDSAHRFADLHTVAIPMIPAPRVCL
jgi:hypothetical protein